MLLTKLKELLDKEKIKYLTITHAPAYTAQETAQSAHITGREMAKPVIVKIDGKMKMVVIPATSKLNLNSIKDFTHSKNVELANEFEFGSFFSDCELGAMPPFGNLFGIEVLIEESLAKNEQIAFNGGTHTELIKLDYKDYEKLVKPTLLKAA